jgi:hypothetical protein
MQQRWMQERCLGAEQVNNKCMQQTRDERGSNKVSNLLMMAHLQICEQPMDVALD